MFGFAFAVVCVCIFLYALYRTDREAPRVHKQETEFFADLASRLGMEFAPRSLVWQYLNDERELVGSVDGVAVRIKEELTGSKGNGWHGSWAPTVYGADRLDKLHLRLDIRPPLADSTKGTAPLYQVSWGNVFFEEAHYSHYECEHPEFGPDVRVRGIDLRRLAEHLTRERCAVIRGLQEYCTAANVTERFFELRGPTTRSAETFELMINELVEAVRTFGLDAEADDEQTPTSPHPPG